jgi:arsenate reductase (thioredoxin)
MLYESSISCFASDLRDTMQQNYRVLFLCTGNSVRSIMAEAIMNGKTVSSFTAYSAGSHPRGFVHSATLRQIEAANLSTVGLRSKNWHEFARPGSPRVDFVFTLCEKAAKEKCPIWPGEPLTAHWGVPAPLEVSSTGVEIEKAFREAFTILDRRISLLMCLPLRELDHEAIKRELDRIGQE